MGNNVGGGVVGAKSSAETLGDQTSSLLLCLLCYHTDICFVYMPQYIILSTNILISSYIHIFLTLQDGVTHSYIEFTTKILSVFYILIYAHIKPCIS